MFRRHVGRTLLTTLAACLVSGVSILEAGDDDKDPTLFSFPRMTPSGPTGLNLLYKASGSIRDATQWGRTLTAQEYDTFSRALQDLADKHPEDRVATGCARWQIVLDWAAGRTTGEDAGKSLVSLAHLIPGELEANFTRAWAAVAFARCHRMDEAVRVFAALKPGRTPQFGWFAFEMTKYAAWYVRRPLPAAERRNGKVHMWSHDRAQECVVFYRDVFLPSLEAYLTAGVDCRRFEGIQFVSVFSKTAEGFLAVFAIPVLPGVSEQTTDELFPRLVKLWERSLGLLGPDNMDIAERNRDMIERYKKKIARIRDMRDQRKAFLASARKAPTSRRTKRRAPAGATATSPTRAATPRPDSATPAAAPGSSPLWTRAAALGVLAIALATVIVLVRPKRRQ